MAVDDRKHLLGLLGHAFTGRRLGHDAREIDGVAMDNGLAHARAGLETLDGHVFLQNVRPLLSAPMRGPPLQSQEVADQATIDALARNGSLATVSSDLSIWS